MNVPHRCPECGNDLTITGTRGVRWCSYCSLLIRPDRVVRFDRQFSVSAGEGLTSPR